MKNRKNRVKKVMNLAKKMLIIRMMRYLILPTIFSKISRIINLFVSNLKKIKSDFKIKN